MKRNDAMRSGNNVVTSGTSHSPNKIRTGDIAMKSNRASLSDSEKITFKDAVFKDLLLDIAESGAEKPAPGTILGDALIRFTSKSSSSHNKMPMEEVSMKSIIAKLTDEEIGKNVDSIIKEILLDMAKNGEDRPKPGTVLGDALIRFTTRPKKR